MQHSKAGNGSGDEAAMRIHTHSYMYTCTDIVTVGVQLESSVKKEEKDFVPSPKTSVASRLPSSGMVSVHRYESGKGSVVL